MVAPAGMLPRRRTGSMCDRHHCAQTRTMHRSDIWPAKKNEARKTGRLQCPNGTSPRKNKSASRTKGSELNAKKIYGEKRSDCCAQLPGRSKTGSDHAAFGAAPSPGKIPGYGRRGFPFCDEPENTAGHEEPPRGHDGRPVQIHLNREQPGGGGPFGGGEGATDVSAGEPGLSGIPRAGQPRNLGTST